MALNTEYLERCILTLESALILEQSGKLLRKKISAWTPSNRAAAELTFKAVFRTAAQHGLLEADECERWLEYRDSRNDTAHQYGEGFAEAAVRQLPQFVLDAKSLARRLHAHGDG